MYSAVSVSRLVFLLLIGLAGCTTTGQADHDPMAGRGAYVGGAGGMSF